METSSPIILFDFFGLFVDDPYRHLFAELMGPDFNATKDRFCGPGDKGEITYDQFLHNIGEHFRRDPNELKERARRYAVVHPEMFTLAKRCKEAHPTYLLSNTMGGMIEDYVPQEEVQACFHRLFLSNEMGLIKPAREAFDYVLDALSVAPSQVYFFDDNPRNVDAAKQVGINSFRFLTVDECEKQLRHLGLL